MLKTLSSTQLVTVFYYHATYEIFRADYELSRVLAFTDTFSPACGNSEFIRGDTFSVKTMLISLSSTHWLADFIMTPTTRHLVPAMIYHVFGIFWYIFPCLHQQQVYSQ